MIHMRTIAKKAAALLLAAACALGAGCSRIPGESEPPEETASPQAALPRIPEKLEKEGGVPVLRVHIAKTGETRKMDIETYVEGVLAGEMRSDWPMEALKAQAILARTFVLKFVSEKESQYEGADISTDISEAQAFDESAVDERVRQAVRETRGQVLSSEGELPYAWFHAHSGGKTELAVPGLEYSGTEPRYTQIVDSPDSPRAPATVQNWTARFSAKTFGEACAKTGVQTGAAETVEIGERGGSGRAATLRVNGMEVSAPALRLAIGSTKMKSTLLEEISLENGEVVLRGRGYGHGVGMSQWGAYALAEEGKSAAEIIGHYFRNVEVVPLWQGAESA